MKLSDVLREIFGRPVGRGDVLALLCGVALGTLVYLVQHTA